MEFGEKKNSTEEGGKGKRKKEKELGNIVGGGLFEK
jgi:hypothetical protein